MEVESSRSNLQFLNLQFTILNRQGGQAIYSFFTDALLKKESKERARCKIACKNKDTDFPGKGWPVSLFVVKLRCETKPYHKRVYNS